MPFVSKATPADSVKCASSSPGERGERGERRHADHSARTAESRVGNGHRKGGTGVTGKGSPRKDGKGRLRKKASAARTWTWNRTWTWTWNRTSLSTAMMVRASEHMPLYGCALFLPFALLQCAPSAPRVSSSGTTE